MTQGSRFTIVHAFIIIALFVVLIACLVPTILNHFIRRGPAAKQNDKANLRGIYQGVMGYAGENNDQYPAYSRTHKHAQGFHAYLRQKNLDPSSESFLKATDSNISAAMWLLVREDHLPVKIFVSPNANDQKADPVTNDQDERVMVTELYDFKSADHFSYSFINFYHENVRKKWSHSVGPSDVLMGNSNDGIKSAQVATDYSDFTSNESMNSLTHDGKGQNLVFGDGHANFQMYPVNTTREPDNVYTWWDQNGDKNDTLSIKALIEGKAAVITSNLAEHTVKAENVKQDTFLLPIQSLADMAGHSITTQPD